MKINVHSIGRAQFLNLRNDEGYCQSLPISRIRKIIGNRASGEEVTITFEMAQDSKFGWSDPSFVGDDARDIWGFLDAQNISRARNPMLEVVPNPDGNGRTVFLSRELVEAGQRANEDWHK